MGYAKKELFSCQAKAFQTVALANGQKKNLRGLGRSKETIKPRSIRVRENHGIFKVAGKNQERIYGAICTEGWQNEPWWT